MLWLIVGVLVFAGVLVFTGVYIFSRYVARQVTVNIRSMASGKPVEVETPAGSLKADSGEFSEQQLALPIYPGARRIKKDGGTVSLQVPSEKSVRVVAATFETDDPFGKVVGFYREQFKGLVRERAGRNEVEFQIDGDGKHQRVVVRAAGGGRTEIALANITEAGAN